MKNLKKTLGVLLLGVEFFLSQLASAKDFHATPETFTGVRNEFISYINTLPPETEETVTLYLGSGLYKFDTGDEIYMHELIMPNLTVHVTAESGATVNFISDGFEYTKNEATNTTSTHYLVPLKGAYTRGEVFVNQDFEIVPISDTGASNSERHINRAEEPIEELGALERRMKLSEELAYLENYSADAFDNSLIWWHMGFNSYYGTIEKIENGYVYFMANGGRQADFVYQREGGNELFYITNIAGSTNTPEVGKILVTDEGIYIPNSVSKLYECKHQSLTWTQENGAAYKELKISNLNFVGASNFDYEKYGGNSDTPEGLTYYRASLLDFSNIDNVTIENCTFRNIGSFYCINNGAATMNYDQMGATNMTVKGCTAYNLGGGFVNSVAKNTVVSGNTIHDIAQFGAMNFAIRAGGPNNVVENNTIFDFPYVGIYAGLMTTTAEHNVSVLVKNNELYMTPDFRKYLYRNTVDDGGALYFYTHHDGSECSGNVVHDISAFCTYSPDANHRSAIMGDDGAYKVKVTGNLVFNVTDWPICFYFNNPGTVPDPFYPSSDNEISGNVLFGPFWYEGNEDVMTSHPNRIGTNYIAKDVNNSNSFFGEYENAIKNCVRGSEDILDESSYVEGGLCYLTHDFSSLELSDFVKSFLRKVEEPQEPETPDTIPVTGVELSAVSLNMTVGDSTQLNATIQPDSATVKTISWTTSDASIATVDSTGKITAVGAGACVVSAISGTVKAECSVTVVEPVAPFVPVSGITLSSLTVKLMEGETFQQTATITPDDATDKKITWTSANTSVATVDSTGLITAVGVGSSFVMANINGLSASCLVTVQSTVANGTVSENVSVWVNGSTLYVNTAKSTTLHIYSINGKLVRTSFVNGSEQFTLSQGTYIVKVEKDFTKKIIIK